MKRRACSLLLKAVFGAFSLTLQPSLQADSFGSGGNAFAIDFVSIGNAGNAADTTGYGAVPYQYRIGKYEISQDIVLSATASGMANVIARTGTGDRPAASIEWLEAAAFVNWLNTSSGYQAAYNLSYNGSGHWAMALWSSEQSWQIGGENLYRHRHAYYFLPSENEWYKAAYHKNDEITANYWAYATGSDVVPDGIDFVGDTEFDAVFQQYYGGSSRSVNDVGLPSPYGTYGQNGNVWEWLESARDGVNDFSLEDRSFRGGAWFAPEDSMNSAYRNYSGPEYLYDSVGFRVASVPEPSTCALIFMGAGAMYAWKRWKFNG